MTPNVHLYSIDFLKYKIYFYNDSEWACLVNRLLQSWSFIEANTWANKKVSWHKISLKNLNKISKSLGQGLTLLWAIHFNEKVFHKTNQKLLFLSLTAYVSWVRYYSNFQKELRNIFCIKAIHLGHYAKCLGLSEAPKQLLQYHTDTKQEKASKASSQRSRNSNKLHRRDENKQSKSVSRNR